MVTMSIKLINRTNYRYFKLFSDFCLINNTDCFDFSESVGSVWIFRAGPSFLRRRATVFHVAVVFHSSNGNFVFTIILLELFDRRSSLFTRSSTSAYHFRTLRSISRVLSIRDHVAINFKRIRKSIQIFLLKYLHNAKLLTIVRISFERV